MLTQQVGTCSKVITDKNLWRLPKCVVGLRQRTDVHVCPSIAAAMHTGKPQFFQRYPQGSTLQHVRQATFAED